jgi:hypothetical protein
MERLTGPVFRVFPVHMIGQPWSAIPTEGITLYKADTRAKYPPIYRVTQFTSNPTLPRGRVKQKLNEWCAGELKL